MIRGLYTAASGMVAEQFDQDAIAANFCNLRFGHAQAVDAAVDHVHGLRLHLLRDLEDVGRRIQL